jgi:hypothetical protein
MNEGSEIVVSPPVKTSGEQWSSVTLTSPTAGVGLLISPTGSCGLSFSAL